MVTLRKPDTTACGKFHVFSIPDTGNYGQIWITRQQAAEFHLTDGST